MRKSSEIYSWKCFCTTRTAVDNPMMQPSGIGQRRSFLILEEGELEGTDGYSAIGPRMMKMAQKDSWML